MTRPIEQRHILNFSNYHDVFDYTADEFNVNKVTGITKEVIDLYIQYSDCWDCPIQYSQNRPICVKDCKHSEWRNSGDNDRVEIVRNNGCNFRAKSDSSPEVPNPYICVQTLAVPKNPNSLIIRRGMIRWHKDNGIDDVIFRGTRVNGADDHHKNLNKFDDTKGNDIILFRHNKTHGILRTLETSLKNTRLLYEKYNREPLTKNITLSLNKAIHFISDDLTDDPLVFQIINLNRSLIKGKISEQEFEKQLIKLKVAKPSGRW